MRRIVMVTALVTASLTGCAPLEHEHQGHDVGIYPSSSETTGGFTPPILSCFTVPMQLDFVATMRDRDSLLLRARNECLTSVNIYTAELEADVAGMEADFILVNNLERATVNPGTTQSFFIHFRPMPINGAGTRRATRLILGIGTPGSLLSGHPVVETRTVLLTGEIGE